MTYKLFKDSMGFVAVVFNAETNASFRLDGDAPEKNVFIADVIGGVELQDVDGNAMTSEDAVAFVSDLS